MKFDFSIFDILKMMQRKWKILFISAIIGIIVAFFYTNYMVTDLYYSRGSLYVDSMSNKDSDDVIYANLITSKELVYTYIEVLQSDRFMDLIAKESDCGYSGAQIKSIVNYNSLNETELLEVSVRTPDAKTSTKIVQTILENANDEMSRIIQGGSVYIVDDASYSSAKVYPSMQKNILLGAFLGIFIAAGVILGVEVFDTRLKSRKDCQEFDLPVLGEIPIMTDPQAEKDKNAKSKGGKKNETV